METTDPHVHESTEGSTVEEGSKLNISPAQAAQIETRDAHWLRMDPSLTRAVLAKTEEELLGGLTALMRNKVEYEQVSRRLTQVQIDTAEAKHELDGVKQQMRRAEEEVATRINEQSRIGEEIGSLRQELALLREECTHLDRIKNERVALDGELALLRSEVHDRIGSREALIQEIAILHRHLSDLAVRKEEQAAELSQIQDDIEKRRREDLELRDRVAEDQQRVVDLLAQKGALEQAVAEAIEKRGQRYAEVAALETSLRELTEARQNAEQARTEDGLPLLFGSEFHPISREWDSYPLESEFHTDEGLDAKKVAELVAQLPGLEGCLIVKNHGPVLAAQLPERIHAHLKVPNRDYNLLFERLEKKVHEYNFPNARLATFDLGDEGLTVVQANHAFVLVNHQRTKLRPGLPDKLASIVNEIAKMYP